MKKAVFAGSFDPFTEGHLDLVQRAAPLFQELIILLAENTQKKYLFSLENRLEWVKKAVAEIPNVRVETYSGLTVDFMKQVNATYLIRGIRSALDFEYERSVAYNNKKMYGLSETILLLCAMEHSTISSSLVRELLRFSASLKGFVPESIRESVERKGKEILCLE